MPQKSTFEVDPASAHELLLALNTVFVEEVAFNLKRCTESEFKEFIQNSIGVETVTLDNSYNAYDTIGEYVWHSTFGDNTSQQNFSTSIREDILENFVWDELVKLGWDILTDDDNLSDQLTDAVVEACESIARGYLILLKDSHCNPKLEQFQQDINESLGRECARLENYAFRFFQTKLEKSMEANR